MFLIYTRKSPILADYSQVSLTRPWKCSTPTLRPNHFLPHHFQFNAHTLHSIPYSQCWKLLNKPGRKQTSVQLVEYLIIGAFLVYECSTHSIVWYKACPYVSTYEEDCDTSLPLTRTEVLPQFVNFVDFMGYKTIIKTKKDIPTQRCELTIGGGGGANEENYLKTYVMANSRQHSRSGEARSCSTRQAIIHLFM
jgi:hypothetical protein